MVTSPISTSAVCVVPLSAWQLIRVSGKDAKTYLQGQLTSDILTLTEHTASFAAHCDAKGKVLSTMLVFFWQNAFYYMVRHSVAASQIDELKKYAVFSDVTIHKASHTIVGLWGENATEVLGKMAVTYPTQNLSIAESKGILVIRLNAPQTRFLLIASDAISDAFKKQIVDLALPSCTETEWLRQDIEAGYPVIDAENFLQFLPQAVGLDKIGGISFNKGCYRGQEMVARATYRGANKRALFCLQGQSRILPVAGDTLQIALGEHWRDSGYILAATPLPEQRVLIQAVLRKETTAQDVFRIKDCPESHFIARVD